METTYGQPMGHLVDHGVQIRAGQDISPSLPQEEEPDLYGNRFWSFFSEVQ